jgi:4-amino-4-deoxy-L-arabinose transferase-like glycosyltransferase
MSAPRSPSGEPWALAPSARLIGLVLILAAVRLAVAASLPLTEDEAYYRLWAQAPALGYFDHPPMIAWWIWLGERLAGDTPLAIRLLPCVACAVTSYFVYDLALGLGADAQSGGRALIWYNATLLVVAGGFLAVPDAPAAFFWTLSLWAVTRAASPAALRWWIVAGLAAGAASLSKYWAAVASRRRAPGSPWAWPRLSSA